MGPLPVGPSVANVLPVRRHFVLDGIPDFKGSDTFPVSFALLYSRLVACLCPEGTFLLVLDGVQVSQVSRNPDVQGDRGGRVGEYSALVEIHTPGV